MARCMTMAGVRPGMVIHNANGYGLFTGGLGFHQGGERIGATVVPVSGGFTTRQAMLLADLGADVLVATPSYALAIAGAIRDAGGDPAALGLQLGLFGGEPWGERMRAEIESALGLAAVSFYGLSEMCGPGVAAECLVAARRAARAGGPLSGRGRRPRQRPAAGAGHRGRARVHDADQGGAAADPLPHRRHRPPDARTRARAGARADGCTGCAAATTTC